jgi:hypothetical protein
MSKTVESKQPTFSSSQGGMLIGTTGNLFVDFSFAATLISSSSNLAISTLATREIKTTFLPTFLKENDIYSASQNIVKGNYKENIIKQDTTIITTYIIPYEDESGINYVTLTTFYDNITKILFYNIPSKFVTKSLIKEKVSISLTTDVDGRIVGKTIIPAIYYSNTKKDDIVIEYEIIPADKFNNANTSVIEGNNNNIPVDTNQIGKPAALVAKATTNNVGCGECRC